MPMSFPSPILRPGFKAGDHINPDGYGATADRTLSTSAIVYAHWFSSPRSVLIDRVGLFLVTSQTGAAARIGIYAPDGAGRPGALLLDAGELDLSTGDGSFVAATISLRWIGGIFVLTHFKNVATQATVKGPSGTFAGLPQAAPSAANSPSGHMQLAAAYPGSMPASAPAVVPTVTGTVTPTPYLRVA